MNSEKRQEVVAWELTPGSMVERSIAAGAVYVTLDDHKKALAKISQLEQQAEEARANAAINYAASENRWHEAEARVKKAEVEGFNSGISAAVYELHRNADLPLCDIENVMSSLLKAKQ